MWARVLLLVCLAGQLQLLDSGFLQAIVPAALQLISNGKTFARVDDRLLSWPDALHFCRLYFTDLADLQSMGSLFSLTDLYRVTSDVAAWIGLFFDVATQQLSWSSGSVFSTPQWTKMPSFGAGICATLHSTAGVPSLGADACAVRKPFICYYDEKVGHRLTTQPPLSLTTSPPPAAVQVGGRTFLRFERPLPWLEALIFCRRRCSDLADLQALGGTDWDALQPIAWDRPEAWIGLYFSPVSGAPRWSSDQGDGGVPSWLEVPAMGVGLCAGLGTFRNFGPRLYVTSCSLHRPFLCFHDPAIGHRTSAPLPVQFLSHVKTTPGTPSVAATPAPALEKTITVRELPEGAQISQEALKPPQLPASTPPAPPGGSTDLQESAVGTPPAPTASPGVTELPLKDPGTPGKSVTHWTATQAATVSPSQGPEVQASETPATPQSGRAGPEGAVQSPTEDTQPRTERRFGILRADFTLPAGVDPEGSREKLLQEVIKLWVSRK
ncbi:putative C-type lectin domain family 20 member A [Sorex fumeus]|uniref:putative C-type lectin domain family 20 member A n=1 Tax=Sorex fumeus TaxID=62283 RepID=UPI0024ADE07F|nr:putative C-type lectin domain family 20 member A [Sorex fumeus]